VRLHRYSCLIMLLAALCSTGGGALAAQTSDEMGIFMQVYSAVVQEAGTPFIQLKIGVFNGRSGVRLTIGDASKATADSATVEPLAHRLAAAAWTALPHDAGYEFVAVGWAGDTGPGARPSRFFEYAPSALDSMPPRPAQADSTRLQPSNQRMELPTRGPTSILG
jgi:hypothetical protein